MSRMKELAERTHSVKFHCTIDGITRIVCSKRAQIVNATYDKQTHSAVLHVLQDRLVLDECERAVSVRAFNTQHPTHLEFVAGSINGYSVYITPVPE